MSSRDHFHELSVERHPNSVFFLRKPGSKYMEPNTFYTLSTEREALVLSETKLIEYEVETINWYSAKGNIMHALKPIQDKDAVVMVVPQVKQT